MKAMVLYYSKSGNTEKVACAVAQGLGVEAKSIDTVKPEDTASYDLICIGTPVHAFRPAKAVTRFVEAMPPLQGKKAAGFYTMSMGGDGGANKSLKLMFEAKGMEFLGGYSCKGLSRLLGNFGPRVVNRGRPSEEELKEAREFGEKLKG